MDIRVEREKARPQRPGTRIRYQRDEVGPFLWSYVYYVDGQRREYGPGIRSFRDMLRHQFPNADVTWTF